MGVPATGRHIEMDVWDVLTVRNGKITSHRALVDQTGLMGQLSGE